MLKSFWLLLALVVLAFAFSPTQNGGAQQAAKPAPAPALAQPPTVTPPPPMQTRNPVKPTAESQAKAKTLYQMDCSMCHGDNGSGKTDLATSMELTMEDWTNPAILGSKQDWELFNIIRNGKDKMPGEDPGRANDTEVWNLIIYIRSFSKGQTAPPATAANPAAPSH
jgi:mono/diheme cytochrome c family protein